MSNVIKLEALYPKKEAVPEKNIDWGAISPNYTGIVRTGGNGAYISYIQNIKTEVISEYLIKSLTT